MRNILLALLLLGSSQAFAWGGRGHDTICRVATFLVKEPGLKEYMQHKPQMMGHLCNMPDFYWKSLGGDAAKLGNSTHFIDIEVIGLDVKDITVDYKQLMTDFTGKPNKFKNDGSTIKSIPQEFGSSWWRADQFMRHIAGLKEDFAKAKAPTSFKEEQDNELPYNKLAYDMVVSMGLMGHFVGDNCQPFHTTADYDGYAAGHGGIHAYFEDQVVGQFDGDLDYLVLKAARGMKNPEFLKPKTAIEKMKVLSVISNKEIPKILKMDPVIKKSTLVKEKGMELKTAAERQPASVAFKKMKPMIVTEMARGAVLLAALWDEAYASAGKPKIGAYKSYKYPFTVDFVAPDYIEVPKAEAKK
ncbi:hypothetical protein AB1A81_02035 [Bdellovibrio bacteriovorus]|uniref:S1/P1 Nuclease n=1 Tax=Bdellovibrio bacteriovorus (strain ATCC 15356 / DSM 50701 / NCIMB 9529 / HD100) TaxID=264462 RepID=Q6MQM4_BDEBA|nr:hypothetical protein [Bdellovibrio bacteriovorus]CAE78423.1 hypothetical protein predicted by Glimmer/Critica [Bdellovibrio bacteriovorus HD100]